MPARSRRQPCGTNTPNRIRRPYESAPHRFAPTRAVPHPFPLSGEKTHSVARNNTPLTYVCRHSAGEGGGGVGSEEGAGLATGRLGRARGARLDRRPPTTHRLARPHGELLTPVARAVRDL